MKLINLNTIMWSHQMIATSTSLIYQSIMDSLPNTVAVGCMKTYDSAMLTLVQLLSKISLKNGIDQSSLGSPSGWRTITNLNASNANENVRGGKESARITEGYRRMRFLAYSKAAHSLPVSTLPNTTNPSACMHKCVRRCSHAIISANSSGYRRKTYRLLCIFRNTPAANFRS